MAESSHYSDCGCSLPEEHSSVFWDYLGSSSSSEFSFPPRNIQFSVAKSEWQYSGSPHALPKSPEPRLLLSLLQVTPHSLGLLSHVAYGDKGCLTLQKIPLSSLLI